MRAIRVLPVFLAVSIFLAADAPKSAEVTTDWPFDAKEAVKRQDDTAKALGKPKQVAADLGGGVAIKFVLIPAGKYKDGSGKDVTIDKPLYFGEFKVTEAQYQLVCGKNPSTHPGPTNPADTIKWVDAVEFAKKASEKSKKHIRLPTEAEWEWACRAGTSTLCYWGDDMKNMGDYCWWHDNCGMKTHPVGEKKPNAFGLYDMMGLLWEWCEGGGPDAAQHPCRGATFGSKVGMFKSSIVITLGDEKINDRFGFRVVMDSE